MGIQDKIFDVEDALEKHGNASAIADYGYIIECFGRQEKIIADQTKELEEIKNGFFRVQALVEVTLP